MSAEQFVVGCILGEVPVPPVIREYVEEYRQYDVLRRESVRFPKFLDDEANAMYDLMVEAVS